MQQIITIIQESVKADAASGKRVDVDAYCERFEKMRPDLNPKDILDVVLDAVASFGGAASWSGGSARHVQ